MKNKLLKEIKEGFDFATQDQIKEAYLNDADLTDEQKEQIK